MNNEPVAYRHLHEDGWEYYDAPTGEDCEGCIPLYTHPVKEQTEKEKWLTEIDAKQQALKKIIDWLILEHDTLACTSYPLRKASEK